VRLFANHIVVNNQVFSARVIKHQQQIQVFCDGCYSFTFPDPLAADSGNDVGGDEIAAPMPGQIKVISVAAGDKVDEGDALLVLEAMKMEHTLTAPRQGVVAEVSVTVEQQVEAGAVLVSFEPEK
jgi:3-methylcrotonyl-CoA carboxylase alpha subunit